MEEKGDWGLIYQKHVFQLGIHMDVYVENRPSNRVGDLGKDMHYLAFLSLLVNGHPKGG